MTASATDALTLVLPTRNRPQFVKRLLKFYRQRRLPHPIVIADSSRAEAARLCRQYADEAGDRLQIEYRSYDPDAEFLIKVSDALAAVKTELAVLCADDDFFVPSSISRCADFLQTHPDYAVAHGRAVSVYARGSVHNYAQRSVEASDPATRLHDHLSAYTTTWYSVHRREALIANISAVAGFSPQATAVRFGELLPSCLSMIQGKAKCLNHLHMIRQDHAISAGKTEVPWPELLISPDYSRHFLHFQSVLADALVRASGTARAEAEKTVAAAFRRYLSNTVSRTLAKDKEVRVDPAESPEPLASRVKRLLTPFRKAYGRYALPRYQQDFAPAYDLIMQYPDATEPQPQQEAA